MDGRASQTSSLRGSRWNRNTSLTLFLLQAMTGDLFLSFIVFILKNPSLVNKKKEPEKELDPKVPPPVLPDTINNR